MVYVSILTAFLFLWSRFWKIQRMTNTLPGPADFQRVCDVLDTGMIVFMLDDYQAWLMAAARAGFERSVISQIESRIEMLVEELGLREFQPELPF